MRAATRPRSRPARSIRVATAVRGRRAAPWRPAPCERRPRTSGRGARHRRASDPRPRGPTVHHAADAGHDTLFPGDSEMARRMRALDWSATDLSAPEEWPAHLRSAVQLCLTSRFPILLWWGPRFSILYNDAYIPFLGSAKHPRALGRPGEECW